MAAAALPELIRQKDLFILIDCLLVFFSPSSFPLLLPIFDHFRSPRSTVCTLLLFPTPHNIYACQGNWLTCSLIVYTSNCAAALYYVCIYPLIYAQRSPYRGDPL